MLNVLNDEKIKTKSSVETQEYFPSQTNILSAEINKNVSLFNSPQNNSFDEESEEESIILVTKPDIVKKRFSKLQNEYQKPLIIITQAPEVDFNIEKYNRVYVDEYKKY